MVLIAYIYSQLSGFLEVVQLLMPRLICLDSYDSVTALLPLAEQTAAFESKPILLKQKSFSLYRPAAFALAQTVFDVPLS